jgi:hypothetical protein
VEKKILRDLFYVFSEKLGVGRILSSRPGAAMCLETQMKAYCRALIVHPKQVTATLFGQVSTRVQQRSRYYTQDQ